MYIHLCINYTEPSFYWIRCVIFRVCIIIHSSMNLDKSTQIYSVQNTPCSVFYIFRSHSLISSHTGLRNYSHQKRSQNEWTPEPHLKRINTSCEPRIKEHQMVFRAELRDPCPRHVTRLSESAGKYTSRRRVYFRVFGKSSNIQSAWITQSYGGPQGQHR